MALARLGRAEDKLRASGALRIGMAAVAGSDPQVVRLLPVALPCRAVCSVLQFVEM